MKEDNKLDNKVKNPEYFTKRPPFINRVEETKYLLDYFANKPRNILFLYWPKSTWKTALIYKIITEKLDRTEYDINFMNLRSVFMANFIDFKNLFFPDNLKWKTKNMLWIIWEIWAFDLNGNHEKKK